MDLLQTVHKEGSRGGRSDFKWDNVKADAHRENYLGHSLMAPVGRWQRNKDLGWYAKGNDVNGQSAADARAEELRKVKEAEEDAMAAALGLPVPARNTNGANAVPLGANRVSHKEMRQAIEQGKDDRETELGRGRGLSEHVGMLHEPHVERLEAQDSNPGIEGRRPHARDGRDRSREKHDYRTGRAERDRRRRRSRSRDRKRHSTRRERTESPSRSRSRERNHKRRERDHKHLNQRPHHRSRSRHEPTGRDANRSNRGHRAGSHDDASRRPRSYSPRDHYVRDHDHGHYR